MIETRSQTLWRHIKAFQHGTRTSWPTIANAVREQYHATVPAELRLVQFSDTKDIHNRMRRDAQTLRRFDFTYEHRLHDYDLPADLEDAIVLALHDLGYADTKQLEVELAARRGMLPVPIQTNGGECAHHTANVMRETADVIDAMADLTADGRVDTDDAPEALDHAELQILEAQTELAALLRTIREARKGQKVRVIR